MAGQDICRVPSDWWLDFSQCLYDWQTLVGGGMAILAAIGTIAVVRCQIVQADRFHQDEINRRRNAARVLLPIALSEISQFCSRSGSRIADEFQRRMGSAAEGAEIEGASLEFVDFPKDAIDVLRSIAENVRHKDQLKHIGELASSLQIFISRYGSYVSNDNYTIEWLKDIFFDCAKCRYLCDEMFNYGRFVADDFAVVDKRPLAEAWDQIGSRALGLVFERRHADPFIEFVNERVAYAKKQGLSPWLERFE